MMLCKKSPRYFKHFLTAAIVLVLSGTSLAHPSSASLIDMEAFNASASSVLPTGARVVASGGHGNEFTITTGQERQAVHAYHRSYARVYALNHSRNHHRHGYASSRQLASRKHDGLVRMAANQHQYGSHTG